MTGALQCLATGGVFQGPGTECGEVDCVCPCRADFNVNGMVDFVDLVELLSRWGDCPPYCPWDLNDSGAVDFPDIVILLSLWGPCP